MDTLTVEIEHIGYWRKLAARIAVLAQTPTPDADEERASIEQEMAELLMALIGEPTDEGEE